MNDIASAIESAFGVADVNVMQSDDNAETLVVRVRFKLTEADQVRT